VLITRQPNIFVTRSLKVGYVDILVLYVAYTTREVHSLDKIFNAVGNLLHQGSLLNQQNPQSIAICERMHQTINNVPRTLVNTNPSCNMTQDRDIIDDALATAMHTMQTAIATTLGSTLGALAFA
jgi:hypothetical protein